MSKIFIVDDDEAVRDSLKLLLESFGFLVEDYASIPDFMRHYRQGQRQCLILDQHLPGLNGLDFLGSPEGAALDLPVIMMTGRGDQTIRARASALGILAYFEKPVPGDLLLATISEAMDRPSTGRSRRPGDQ